MNKAEFMDKAKNNPVEALEQLFDALEASELLIGELMDAVAPYPDDIDAQNAPDAVEADLINV